MRIPLSYVEYDGMIFVVDRELKTLVPIKLCTRNKIEKVYRNGELRQLNELVLKEEWESSKESEEEGSALPQKRSRNRNRRQKYQYD